MMRSFHLQLEKLQLSGSDSFEQKQQKEVAEERVNKMKVERKPLLVCDKCNKFQWNMALCYEIREREVYKNTKSTHWSLPKAPL